MNEIREKGQKIRQYIENFRVIAPKLDDADALTIPELYKLWQPSTDETPAKYLQGEIIRRLVNGEQRLYRIEQPEVTPIESQPPEAEGMLAVYRPIVPGTDGTADDPTPYIYGMNCYAGNIYSYEGTNWRAIQSMTPCVWPPQDGLPAVWERA
jgi:hypothetical protein